MRSYFSQCREGEGARPLQAEPQLLPSHSAEGHREKQCLLVEERPQARGAEEGSSREQRRELEGALRLAGGVQNHLEVSNPKAQWAFQRGKKGVWW